MDEDSERGLASRILDNDDKAWRDFLGRYEKRMQKVAKRMTNDSSLNGEELVQAFLVDRLCANPESMFGRVARGERPLWPRLSRSMANYCIDAIRRRNRETARLSHTDSKRPDGESPTPGSSAPPTVTWQAVQTLVTKRLKAIRAMNPGPRVRVPLGELLLLSERVILSQQIMMSYAGAEEATSGDATPQAFRLAEEAGPWEKGEKGMRLPVLNKPLREVWQDTKQQMSNGAHTLDGYAVA